ncbi:MAG: hypothetical protein SH818_16740 [Saprospiraceae bacterium]|nr:hypothetical protein [Saprospiraceae bacterium]
MDLANLLGATGVFLILLAYFFNLYKKLETDNLYYILMNLVGAILASISSIMIHSLPFTVLETTWAIVSFIALIKLLKRQ